MTVSMHPISCIRLYKDMIQLEQQREFVEVDYDGKRKNVGRATL